MEDKFDYKEREKYQKAAQKRRREERWDERVLFRLFVLWRGIYHKWCNFSKLHITGGSRVSNINLKLKTGAIKVN